MSKLNRISSGLLAGCLMASLPLVTFPLSAQDGVQTQTVVTVIPKSGNQTLTIPEAQVQATVSGKRGKITSWTPLRGEQSGLQIVVLIDSSARSGLSLQYNDLRSFVQALPEGAQVGVAYMQNGRAVMAQNITPDHKLAANAFRLTSGVPGQSASPYFCLSTWSRTGPQPAQPIAAKC